MISRYMDPEADIPDDVATALAGFSALCMARGVENVTEETVREYLRERGGDALAAAFSPSYMLPA